MQTLFKPFISSKSALLILLPSGSFGFLIVFVFCESFTWLLFLGYWPGVQSIGDDKRECRCYWRSLRLLVVMSVSFICQFSCCRLSCRPSLLRGEKWRSREKKASLPYFFCHWDCFSQVSSIYDLAWESIIQFLIEVIILCRILKCLSLCCYIVKHLPFPLFSNFTRRPLCQFSGIHLHSLF